MREYTGADLFASDAENQRLVGPVRDMKRITQNDWKHINAALALYEASGGDLNFTGAELDKFEDEVEIVRSKVHERLEQRWAGQRGRKCV